MTTEQDKQLLLKDLSARLPYGVKCKIEKDWFYDEIKPYDSIFNPIILERLLSQKDTDYCVKPYLRQMSSMTEDEKEELRSEFGADMRDENNGRHTEIYGYVMVYHNFNGESWYIPFEAIDWLNAHHFDYRGLIEMGLALEASEGMYALSANEK